MLPPLADYYHGLTGPVIAAMGVGATLTIVTIGLFFGNLPSVLKHTPKRGKSKTVFLLAIYQIVAISQFLVILIPRSIALAETISVLSFGFGALIFHGLMLDYVGGESNLIKKSQFDAFAFRVRPCCLLPFGGPSEVTKAKLIAVRLMILQFPVIHTLIYVFYNMRIIEQPTMSTIYFMPIMVASIIPVVWGLNMVVHLVQPLVPDYPIQGKYLILQFVLLVCKIQPAIADLIYQNVTALKQVQVVYPMSVEVYKNIIISTIIIIQMVLMSLGAQSYYRIPRRDSDEQEEDDKVEVVSSAAPAGQLPSLENQTQTGRNRETPISVIRLENAEKGQ